MEQVEIFGPDVKEASHQKAINEWLKEHGKNIEITARLFSTCYGSIPHLISVIYYKEKGED